MGASFSGKALVYGDNINTDIISPPQSMELPIEEATKYAMSAIDPDFYQKVGPDTVLVAGDNFGSGSSRETAPLVLKHLGVRVLLAKSFARIFFRNAINLGLVAVECADAGRVSDGDRIELNVYEGTVCNRTKAETYQCSRFPDHIMALIEAGGLYESLRKRMENERI